jgi:hypothetical protein
LAFVFFLLLVVIGVMVVWNGRTRVVLDNRLAVRVRLDGRETLRFLNDQGVLRQGKAFDPLINKWERVHRVVISLDKLEGSNRSKVTHLYQAKGQDTYGFFLGLNKVQREYRITILWNMDNGGGAEIGRDLPGAIAKAVMISGAIARKEGRLSTSDYDELMRQLSAIIKKYQGYVVAGTN